MISEAKRRITIAEFIEELSKYDGDTAIDNIKIGLGFDNGILRNQIIISPTKGIEKRINLFRNAE